MARKPKPPLSMWLVAQRRAHGETPEDVARVVNRKPATIRAWEAGRPPQGDDLSIVALEWHWESTAPKEAPPGDQTGLVAALTAQTVAINSLVELLGPLVHEQDEAVRSNSELLGRLLEQVLQAETRLSALERTAG